MLLRSKKHTRVTRFTRESMLLHNKKHTRVTRFTMSQSYYVTKLIKIALCLKTYIDFFCSNSNQIRHVPKHRHAPTVELVYDISFLKLLQLIVDGDIESNPRPSNTPTGTPKGRKTKRNFFF